MKIIIIKMIQKLDYIFSFQFWILTSLTVVMSDDIFLILELLGVLLDFRPNFQGL